MDPEEQLEKLRCALQQVNGAIADKKLELARLAVEAMRLTRNIAEVTASLDKDSGSESDSDREPLVNLSTGSWLELFPAQEWKSGSQRSTRRREPEEVRAGGWVPSSGSMRRLASEASVWLPDAGGQPQGPPLGSLAALNTEPPPRRYDCFLAGLPLVCTVLNDLATLGCHVLRSLEVTRLGSQSLASRSEQEWLQKESNLNTIMDWPLIVNFVVWRRSLIVVLSLANLGAFCFSLFGDNWATFRHMRDMHEVSEFQVSYNGWKEGVITRLPMINCEDVDSNFDDLLSRQSSRHEVVAQTCAGLLRAGIGCAEPISKVISGCWQPDFCSDRVSQRCPLACSGQRACRDTRDLGVLTYGRFTAAFGKAMAYMLIEKLSNAELWKLGFLTGTKLVASLFLARAARNWASWSCSNRSILCAWLVTFCAPFMLSLVPTLALIDWGPIEQKMDGFLVATNHHYNISQRMGTLSRVAGISCTDQSMEDRVDKTWSTVHRDTVWWCSKVVSAAGWFPWSKVLQKGAKECQVVTNEIGLGDDATHVVRVDKGKLCGMINRTKVEDVRENPLSSLREVFDVPWVRSAARGITGTTSSILSFRALMPLALSIAPGLLTSAIRMKVVIPESSLPGAVIVTMPLLYVPLIWSFLIFVAQGTDDPCLLAGVALLAFSPLLYTVVAVPMRVLSPMSRRRAQAFAERVWWCVAITRAVAVLCIVTYFTKLGMHVHEIETSQKGLAAFLIEQGKQLLLPLLVFRIDSVMSIVLSGQVWSLIFSFIVQLYLTAIVASDWLLRASAEEWDSHGKECLEELRDEDNHYELEFLHRRREEYMKAILELTLPKRLGH